MIYVITYGSYSDYHICAATTNKDRAEQLKLIFSDQYEPAQIEEFEDGKILDVNEENVVYPWLVILRKNYMQGSQINVVRVTQYAYEQRDNKPFVTQTLRTNNDNNFSLRVDVLADDKDHAIKIAYDKFAEWMAEVAGL